MNERGKGWWCEEVVATSEVAYFLELTDRIYFIL